MAQAGAQPFSVGLYSGKEATPQLHAFELATGLLRTAAKAHTLRLNGKELPARVLLCSDYQLFVHLHLCWGSGASLPTHSFCVWCQQDTAVLDTWPDPDTLPIASTLQAPAHCLWPGPLTQVRPLQNDA